MKGSSKPSSNPAVAVARNVNGRSATMEITLPTGVVAVIKPVTASLIDAVTSRIKDPPVPMWHNPDKDTDEPNPNHPDYIAALNDVERQRGMAAVDAMVMFGVDLPNGLPADDSWVNKLRFMEKHGQLDLTGYDLDDPLDREFLFKRYVAVDTSIIEKITELSGISAAEVTAAEDSFSGN